MGGPTDGRWITARKSSCLSHAATAGLPHSPATTAAHKVTRRPTTRRRSDHLSHERAGRISSQTTRTKPPQLPQNVPSTRRLKTYGSISTSQFLVPRCVAHFSIFWMSSSLLAPAAAFTMVATGWPTGTSRAATRRRVLARAVGTRDGEGSRRQDGRRRGARIRQGGHVGGPIGVTFRTCAAE